MPKILKIFILILRLENLVKQIIQLQNYLKLHFGAYKKVSLQIESIVTPYMQNSKL